MRGATLTGVIVIRNNSALYGLGMVSGILGLGFMIALHCVYGGAGAGAGAGGGFIQQVVFSKENINGSTGLLGRKLLALQGDGGDDSGGDGGGTMNRVGSTCSKDNIVIFQGPTTPLPNGIPTYTVQIMNTCVSGCSVSNIHLSCGWFSSARLINPRVFRRVCYDDCLVNNGEALSPGDSLSFQYANTFSYRLSVSSVACV